MAEEQLQPLDANSRLKARIRATVPPRETSLLKREKDEGFAGNGLIQESDPDLEQLNTKQQFNNATKQQSNDSVKSQPLVSFTLRVDETIDKGLKEICSEEKITKETFLEAAFLVCQQNDDVMEKVLKISKERRKKRRATGVSRRAQSMTKYLS